MARTGIKTSPGQGPELETIARPSGVEVPVVTSVNVGAWGYAAGVSGSPSLPAGARVLSLSCVADTDATVSIDGGDDIPLPEGLGFSMTMDADLFDPVLVFTGTATYVVQYVVEPA